MGVSVPIIYYYSIKPPLYCQGSYLLRTEKYVQLDCEKQCCNKINNCSTFIKLN